MLTLESLQGLSISLAPRILAAKKRNTLKEIPNILVVCGRNKRRSKTAESIYRKEKRFNIQSAGLSPKSPSQISEAKINWADAILVMEDGHKSRITGQYRHIELPAIHVLHIEDEYTYMQAELVEILEDRIPSTLKYEMTFWKED